MSRLPSFAIDRLGPAEVPSPLRVIDGGSAALFVPEDARALYDTVGHGWHHGQMLEAIEPVRKRT